MHNQQPPGVVQNRSALQCSKQNTEQCCYDHAPVTRGRMRAQFPLPHGPWDHVPPHVWIIKSNSATMQDEAEDEAEVCVLCCWKPSTITVCGECEEHYCAECIDTHTCGTNVVC